MKNVVCRKLVLTLAALLLLYLPNSCAGGNKGKLGNIGKAGNSSQNRQRVLSEISARLRGLSPAQKQKVARKIWTHESNATVDGLTAWNSGENFASLGIGHFIWLPAGQTAKFEESFPKLQSYLLERARRAQAPPMPRWLAEARDCPWQSKNDFYQNFQSPRMRELRSYLRSTINQQCEFIILRLESSLAKILAASPPSTRQNILRHMKNLSGSAAGVYAMIDYVNFKGEGLNPSESYRGEGWGLRHALQIMPANTPPSAAVAEFAKACERVLRRRVSNSPPARGESRWLAGWTRRCRSYAEGF